MRLSRILRPHHQVKYAIAPKWAPDCFVGPEKNYWRHYRHLVMIAELARAFQEEADKTVARVLVDGTLSGPRKFITQAFLADFDLPISAEVSGDFYFPVLTTADRAAYKFFDHHEAQGYWDRGVPDYEHAYVEPQFQRYVGKLIPPEERRQASAQGTLAQLVQEVALVA